MKKTIILSFVIVFLFAGIVSAHHPDSVLPGAGITPESPFYFLDTIGEALQEFFTFNPEGKAHLHIAFASERIAEIKVVLDAKGVDAKGLDVAESRLRVHVANASAIVLQEKSKGKDVRALAKELRDAFKSPKEELLRSFKAQEQALEAKEDDLESQLKAAHLSGNAAEAEKIAADLGGVKAQLELLELKKDDLEDELDAEEEKIEEEMDMRERAEEAIREAEEEKQDSIDEAAEEGVEIPSGAFAEFDALLVQAKDAFEAGNFEEARLLAKQAEHIADGVEEMIEELEEEKELQEEEEEEMQEREEELMEKEAEKAEEEREKQEEAQEDTEDIIQDEIEDAEEEAKEEDEKEDAAAAQQQQVVIYTNSGFAPSSVTVKKGETVLFENASSRGMWVASDFHPSHTIYSAFDQLTSVGNGESWEFQFMRQGTWKYHNHVNASHGGTIVVE